MCSDSVVGGGALHFFNQTTRDNLLAGEEGDMLKATCPVLLAPHLIDNLWWIWIVVIFEQHLQIIHNYCPPIWDSIHIPGRVGLACQKTKNFLVIEIPIPVSFVFEDA